MDTIRIDPVSAIARLYKEGINKDTPLYLEKTPYYKTLILVYLDNGSVRIEGSIETPSVPEVKQLFRILKEQGYIQVHWRHKDKNVTINL